MTTNTPDLKPCPFDPSVEENWHFHDEYEFWYMGFPEMIKPDAKYKIDLARERGFKPWEEYINYTRPDHKTKENAAINAADIHGELDGAVKFAKKWLYDWIEDDKRGVYSDKETRNVLEILINHAIKPQGKVVEVKVDDIMNSACVSGVIIRDLLEAIAHNYPEGIKIIEVGE